MGGKAGHKTKGHIRCQRYCKGNAEGQQVFIKPYIPGKPGELDSYQQHHCADDGCRKRGKESGN